MYKIKGDGIIIYSNASLTESMNAVNPKLTLIDNAAGSLDISLPPGNAGYDTLERRTSEIVVYRDNADIWHGRIISERMDFWNNRILTCEGELSYLNDTIQSQHKYEKGTTVLDFLTDILSEHNKRYDNERYKFYVDISKSMIYNYSEILPEIVTDYESTFDCINENLIAAFNCHIRIERVDGKKYIGFVKEESLFNENTQTIRFGENLLDFTKNWDLTDLATVIIPRGAVIEQASDENSDSFDKYVTLSDIPKDDVVEKQEIGEYRRDADGNLEHDADGNLIYDYFDKTDENGNLIYKYKKDTNGYIPLESDNNNVTIRVNTKESDDKVVVEFLEYHENENGTIQIVSKIETDGTYADVYLKNEEDEFYCLKDIYGRSEQIVDFSEAEDSIELLKKTRDYLKEHQFDQMTLEVSAVDMRYLSQSSEPVKLLDRIRCISYPHGMNTLFTVTELSVELNKPESAKYTLEKTMNYSPKITSSLSDAMSSAVAEISSPHSEILIRAKTNADKILRENTNGYVTLVSDTTGGRHSDSLIISSGKDYKRSEHFWIWNSNGLGHYTEYAGEDPPILDEDDKNSKWMDKYVLNLGMTMDGAIVANRITVGHMSADRVRTGLLMSQDRNVVWNLNEADHEYIYTDAGGNETREIYPGGSLTIQKGSIALGDSFGNWNGAFCVDDGGNLHAEKGNIGGFVIEADNIHNDAMLMNNNGLHLWERKKDIGYIGIGYWNEEPSKKSLAMNLENDGSAIWWSYRQKASDDTFTVKMLYAAEKFDRYQADTLYVECDMDLSGHAIGNCNIIPNKIKVDKASTLDECFLLSSNAINEDGTVNKYELYRVRVENGFIVNS